MNAIPTKYNGVQFRSRLEARWAAFFDLLGWQWEYEPVDLNGYIPDFILRFQRPLLVEVKPLVSNVVTWTDCDGVDAYAVHSATRKIEDSGWTGDALLVGAVLHTSHAMGYVVNEDEDPVNLGLHLEWFRPEGSYLVVTGEKKAEGDRLSGSAFGIKACCNGPVNVVMDFSCLRCGHHDKGPTLISSAQIVSMWREAANAVQWRGAPISRAPRSRGYALSCRAWNAESAVAYCWKCGHGIGDGWPGFEKYDEFEHFNCDANPLRSNR